MMRTVLAIALVAATAAAEDDLRTLLRNLESGERVATRARAAWALGYRRDTFVPWALEAALKDPAPEVRHAAAVSLSLLEPELGAGVPALIASLRAPDWHRRWQACIALRRLGPRARAAAPALAAVLCAPDLDTCREAAHALEVIGRGSSAATRKLRWLSLGFHVTDQRAFARAVKALDPGARRRHRTGIATEPLLAQLMSDNPKRRAWAATELATLRLGDVFARADVEAALAEVLDDPEPEVRRAARRTLSVHGMKADLPRTRARLVAVERFLSRIGAASLIGARSTPDPVFGYFPVPVHDEDGHLYARLYAAVAEETRPRLREGLAHLFWSDPEFGGDLLHYGAPQLRAIAVLLVPSAPLARNQATVLVRYGAGDTDRLVRTAAGRAEDELRTRPADPAPHVPALVRALDATDWLARWRACVALERIGPPAREAVPGLLDAIGVGDEALADAAGHALVHIATGDAEVAEQLMRLDRAMPAERKHRVRDPLRRIDGIRYLALITAPPNDAEND